MASLGTLTADLVLQIAQWTGPLDKAEKDLLDFHKNVQKTVTDITKEFTKFAAETTVAIVGVRAVLEDFKAALDWGKQIELLSRQTGLQAEQMDALALAAKLSDVSVDQLALTLDRLSKSMVQARNPANAMADIFKALNVDPSGNPGKVLLETVAAINSIPDPALRAATAIAVLGKGGADTANRLASLAEDARLADEAIAAFGAVSQQQADAAKSISDSFDLAGEAMRRIIGPALVPLAGAFEDIVRAMEAVVGESDGVAAALGGALADALRIIAALLVDLVSGVQTVIIVFVDLARTADAMAAHDWKGVFSAAADALKDLGAVAKGTAAAHSALLTPAVEGSGKAARQAAIDEKQLQDAITKSADEAKSAADELAKYIDKLNLASTAKSVGLSPESVKALEELGIEFDAGTKNAEQYNAEMALIIQNDSVLTGEQNKVAEATKHAADSVATLKEKWEGVLAAQQGGVSPQTVKALAELDTILKAAHGHWADYAAIVAIVKAQDPVSVAQKKSIEEADAAISKMTDSLLAQNQAYGDEIAMMAKTETERAQAIAQQRIQNDLAQALLVIQKQYANDPARMAAATKEAQDNAAAAGQVANAWAAATVQEKAYYAIINAQQAANVQLAEEVKLLGVEGVAREQKLADLKLEAALTAASTQAEVDKARAVFATTQGYLAQKAAFEATQKSVAAWTDVFKTLDDWGNKFFQSMSQGLKGVKDWAKQAGDALKNYMLQMLYELTVKPFVVRVVTSVAGSLGADTSAIAQAAGASNQGGILSSLGSLFGGGGGTSMLGTIGGGIASLFGGGAAAAAGSTAAVVGMGGGTASLFGGAAAGASALATEMTATTATTAALGAGAATATVGLASMIPVVGAFIAVGYLAYTLLSQAKGGPKSGGYAVGGDVAAGSPASRFFTPGDKDADIAKLTSGISDAFTTALTQLGGKGSAAFALGFDTDPQGKAGSRVSSAAYVGGKAVYATHDVDVGRDDAAVQAAMQTETERLLLAALQASDLPESMARILNTVAAATASATDVANVVALAGAFRQVQVVAEAMVNPLDAAAQAINDASTTAMQSYEKQRDAFSALVDATDPTAEGLANLAQAATDLYKSTVQLLAGMVQLKQQISGMFGDTRENILRSTMDTPTLYEHIRQQTQGLYTQLQTATDPADINRITSAINANINTAWGMLTPAQQRQEQADFLARLDDVNALAQQRIDAGIQAVTDQSNADQATLTDQLTKILDTITGAAKDFQAGSDTVAKAAGAGFTVTVHVTDDRAVAEVSG